MLIYSQMSYKSIMNKCKLSTDLYNSCKILNLKKCCLSNNIIEHNFGYCRYFFYRLHVILNIIYLSFKLFYCVFIMTKKSNEIHCTLKILYSDSEVDLS